MSGTGASNLGYGGTAPLSNVNGQYVNVTSSNNPANFSSNETMQTGFGLFGTKINVAAAAGQAPPPLRHRCWSESWTTPPNARAANPCAEHPAGAGPRCRRAPW